MQNVREGLIGPNLKWWTPEQVHAYCRRRMELFDRLRREARDLINEHNTLQPHQIKTSAKTYAAFRQSYFTF